MQIASNQIEADFFKRGDQIELEEKIQPIAEMLVHRTSIDDIPMVDTALRWTGVFGIILFFFLVFHSIIAG